MVSISSSYRKLIEASDKLKSQRWFWSALLFVGFIGASQLCCRWHHLIVDLTTQQPARFTGLIGLSATVKHIGLLSSVLLPECLLPKQVNSFTSVSSTSFFTVRTDYYFGRFALYWVTQSSYTHACVDSLPCCRVNSLLSELGPGTLRPHYCPS